MNTLIIIGDIGNKSCYLNVPRASAINRFIVDNNLNADNFDNEFTVEIIKFTDEFTAYEVWKK